MSVSNIDSLKDILIGALIGLARAVEGNEAKANNTTINMITKGLCALNDADEASLVSCVDAAHEEKKLLVPRCFSCASSCGRNNDFDMQQLCDEPADIRALKILLLYACKGLAAVCVGKDINAETSTALYKALYFIGFKDCTQDDLFTVIKELGEAGAVRKSGIYPFPVLHLYKADLNELERSYSEALTLVKSKQISVASI